MPDQTDTHFAQQFDVDQILAGLNVEFGAPLPEEAIRAAQQRREEVIPGLIDLLHQATERVRRGEELETFGYFFAIYLLAEFGARQALPAVVDALSLPDDGPEVLYGDAITEDLPSILAELAAESLETIEGLIANDSLDEFVRGAAADTYLLLVRDGRLAREEAVERLRVHLQRAIDEDDIESARHLVCSLISYAPHEAAEDIQEAFSHGMLDEWYADLSELDESLEEGEAWFQRELEACRPTGIPDTVERLRCWDAFDVEDAFDVDEEEDAEFDDDILHLSSFDVNDYVPDPPPETAWEPATIRNSTQRVGRNDPCPCGSGKKFKRCCARN
jgi:hypothetical protein